MPSDLLTARGYLIDLDGTLVAGQQLLPGARELLARLAGRFVIVSNDSEHTPEQLVRRFGEWGVHLGRDELVLAGTTAVDAVAAEKPNARLMLLASTALRTYARGRGLALDHPHPDAVLVARDRRFTYAKLAAAAQAIAAGARLYVACPDTSHPGRHGQPVPEAGALAAAILAAAGPVPHTVIGKPHPAMFAAACARLGIAPSEGVMIGDNPETDGAGALTLGLKFWQVAPGGIAIGAFSRAGRELIGA